MSNGFTTKGAGDSAPRRMGPRGTGADERGLGVRYLAPAGARPPPCAGSFPSFPLRLDHAESPCVNQAWPRSPSLSTSTPTSCSFGSGSRVGPSRSAASRAKCSPASSGREPSTNSTYTKPSLYSHGVPADAPPRPRALFDREHEWADLAQFATAAGAGLRLALVRGRRRQGKSFLLRRLVRTCGGFYHQALEEGASPALAGLGADLGRRLGVPGAGLALGGWDEAVRSLAGIGGRRDRPALVVLERQRLGTGVRNSQTAARSRSADARRAGTWRPAEVKPRIAT